MSTQHRFRWRFTGPMLLTVLCAGCTSEPPVTETPPPTVTVSQPVVREVVDFDTYEGRIAAIETVEMRARVSGYLMEVNFEDGQMVDKGKVMFVIDPRPYKASLDAAKAQQSSAEAALELAKKEYARYAPLVQKGAATREEMDVWAAKQTVATAERLKALANVEQAQLDLDFTRMEAPIAGKTSRTRVTVGNLVTPANEAPLTTITSVDPMYVYFDVDERHLLQYRTMYLKPGADPSVLRQSLKELKIPVEVGLEGESGFPHKGLLDFAENRVNASTGTIQVRGSLPNSARLLDAGMRARVRIPIGDPHKSLLITERAVGTDQGLRFVYVVNGKNEVERRDVQLGRVAESMQAITDGLKPDEWVIVNGIQRVRDGMKVDPKRAPMPGSAAVAAGQGETTPQGSTK